jgi:hypothetical protein
MSSVWPPIQKLHITKLKNKQSTIEGWKHQTFFH